jgi:hypothetical protein
MKPIVHDISFPNRRSRTQVIDAALTASDLADVANVARVERDAVRGWAYRDPDFIASINERTGGEWTNSGPKSSRWLRKPSAYSES